MLSVKSIRQTIESRLKAVQRDNELNVSDRLLQKIAEDLTSAIEDNLRDVGWDIPLELEEKNE